MNQRSAFVAALGLTVFVLFVMGGVVTRVAGQSVAAELPATATATTVATALPPPPPDASALKAIIVEREASYQQLLDQANKQIEQANGRMQEQSAALEKAQQQARTAQARLAQPQAQPTASVSKHAVSTDNAAEIALKAAPGAKLLRAAELVNFQGKVAYEVALDKGMVYVDAEAGVILHNGAVPAVAAASGGGGGNGGGGQGSPGVNSGREHEQEHENEHEDKQGHENEHEHEDKDHDDD